MLDPRHIQARLATLKGLRANHDSVRQDIANYMIPSRAFTTTHAAGAKRNQLIFNGHAPLALEQLAGGLHGMLTSPALRWFALRPMPELAIDREVRAWFEAATDVMYAYFQSPDTGFNATLHEAYLDLGGFGEAVVFTPDRGRRGPLYQAIPLAECWFAENADRRVDTLYRAYDLPLREVLRLWPSTAPDRLRAMAEKRPDHAVPIVHATEPDPNGRGFHTCWCTGADWLEHGRYSEFPFAVPRWAKRSGEVHGTGPGTNALADTMMLNRMEQLNLVALAKLVDPARFMPHDGFVNAPNFNPGANNYYDSSIWRGGQNPIFTMESGRPDLAERKIEQVQDRISASFYTTWLRLPQQPNMTATEVLQRRDELLRLLGPMVARLEAELLSPLVSRSFAILMRNGLFPPPPAQLQGAGWTVEYLGPLSRAQKQADAETVMRFLGAMQPLMQIDPSVAQEVHPGRTAEFLADRTGLPTKLLRTEAELATLREAKAQQEATMGQAQVLREGAAAAKDGAGALAALAGIGGGAQ
jgi:hypothetical protein